MKHLKRIAVLIFGGFIAFAPPGTLIFGAILILGLIGNFWAIIGGIVILTTLVAVLLLRRRNLARRRNPYRRP